MRKWVRWGAAPVGGYGPAASISATRRVDFASVRFWQTPCIRIGEQMQRNATYRVVLAVLGILFLLLNPAGICAGTPGTQSPSHPCCPKPSGPAQAPATSSCVCIDRQPAAPSLPSLSDSGPVAPVVAEMGPVVHAALPPGEFAELSGPVGPPQDISVSFHQLLL